MVSPGPRILGPKLSNSRTLAFPPLSELTQPGPLRTRTKPSAPQADGPMCDLHPQVDGRWGPPTGVQHGRCPLQPGREPLRGKQIRENGAIPAVCQRFACYRACAGENLGASPLSYQRKVLPSLRLQWSRSTAISGRLLPLRLADVPAGSTGQFHPQVDNLPADRRSVCQERIHGCLADSISAPHGSICRSCFVFSAA